MTAHEELLAVAERLLADSAIGRSHRGAASARRSASTSYYALFHFVTAECGFQLLGGGAEFDDGRRLLARTLTHGALAATFEKVRSNHAKSDVREFLRLGGTPHLPVEVPAFVRTMATTFLETQNLRHQADYDLGSEFETIDAERTITDVRAAIRIWSAAVDREDRRWKKAVCLLATLRGKLRGEGG